MARQRVTGAQRVRGDTARLADEEWAWVTDAFPVDDPQGHEAQRMKLNPFFPFLVTEVEEREMWERLGPQAVRSWVAVRPGTRPRLWWTYEAPDLAASTGTDLPPWRIDAAEQRSTLARLGALQSGE